MESEKKTYFVISDVHGFYTVMEKALCGAGFRKSNKNHILIICGDVFDRGPESPQVYRYIMSIPKSRRILIRGNHEDLFIKLLDKDLPDPWDFSNGTVDTFLQFSGLTNYQDIYYLLQLATFYRENVSLAAETWRHIKEVVSESSAYKWLLSDEWKNYYELDNYIFVHSFFPIKLDAGYHSLTERCSIGDYDPNWREVVAEESWVKARWGCPYELWSAYFQEEAAKGKILVCGHWHARDFHKYFKTGRNTDEAYYGEYLIALDATTARSGIVNVLKI